MLPERGEGEKNREERREKKKGKEKERKRKEKEGRGRKRKNPCFPFGEKQGLGLLFELREERFRVAGEGSRWIRRIRWIR